LLAEGIQNSETCPAAPPVCEMEAAAAPLGGVSAWCDVLARMKSDGVPRHDWSQVLQPCLLVQLQETLDAFPVPKEETERLEEELRRFQGPPFTLQRLCELLTSPRDYYSQAGKLVFGLEKLLIVSSVLQIEKDESAAHIPSEKRDAAMEVDERGNSIEPMARDELVQTNASMETESSVISPSENQDEGLEIVTDSPGPGAFPESAL